MRRGGQHFTFFLLSVVLRAGRRARGGRIPPADRSHSVKRARATAPTRTHGARGRRREKGIFIRKMLGFKEKSRLAAIRQKYQEDGEFMQYVDRYLSQFDSFLKEAKKRDHREVLSTTFLSSDMGKVYMLLARALGRDI